MVNSNKFLIFFKIIENIEIYNLPILRKLVTKEEEEGEETNARTWRKGNRQNYDFKKVIC